jgi:hypothetical protein
MTGQQCVSGHEPNLGMTESPSWEHVWWWQSYCSFFFLRRCWSGPTSTQRTNQTAESTSTTNRHRTLKSTIMCLPPKHIFKIENLELKKNMWASNAHETKYKKCQKVFWVLTDTRDSLPVITYRARVGITLLSSIWETHGSNPVREMRIRFVVIFFGPQYKCPEVHHVM